MEEIREVEKTKEEIRVFLCEGVYTIKDFHALWLKDKKVAKRIFYYKEFKLWLLKLKFPFMHFFEYFLKDTNKERAINNFFALSNLNEEINLDIKIDEEKNKIIVTKKSEAFLEEKIYSPSNLITFSQNYITNRDFEQGESKEIAYFVDLKKVNKTQFFKIYIGERFVELKIQKKDFLEIELLSNFQRDGEIISISITNNSGENIPIEFEVSDVIKLKEHKYIVGEEPLLIDFKTELSPLLRAKKTLGKAFVFKENIRVHSRFENKRFYKDIKLTIGDFEF